MGDDYQDIQLPRQPRHSPNLSSSTFLTWPQFNPQQRDSNRHRPGRCDEVALSRPELDDVSHRLWLFCLMPVTHFVPSSMTPNGRTLAAGAGPRHETLTTDFEQTTAACVPFMTTVSGGYRTIAESEAIVHPTMSLDEACRKFKMLGFLYALMFAWTGAAPPTFSLIHMTLFCHGGDMSTITRALLDQYDPGTEQWADRWAAFGKEGVIKIDDSWHHSSSCTATSM